MGSLQEQQRTAHLEGNAHGPEEPLVRPPVQGLYRRRRHSLDLIKREKQQEQKKLNSSFPRNGSSVLNERSGASLQQKRKNSPETHGRLFHIFYFFFA